MSVVTGTSSSAPPRIAVKSPEAYFNRELSWLGFASRVVALVENRELPLLERVKFAGIAGMLHDEFFMKRISGLKRQIRNRSKKTTIDGRSPETVFRACQVELRTQSRRLGETLLGDLGPAMAAEGVGIVNYDQLQASQRRHLREYFQDAVMPILTPLAVDSEHPFPFISNLGLNLAILFPGDNGRERFVRIKVPDNRPRWVPLPDGSGFTPLEQVITGNIDLLYPEIPPSGNLRVPRDQGQLGRSGSVPAPFGGRIPGPGEHHSAGGQRVEGQALRGRGPARGESGHAREARRVADPAVGIGFG